MGCWRLPQPTLYRRRVARESDGVGTRPAADQDHVLPYLLQCDSRRDGCARCDDNRRRVADAHNGCGMPGTYPVLSSRPQDAGQVNQPERIDQGVAK